MGKTCVECKGKRICTRCGGSGNAKKFITHPDPKRVKEDGSVKCPFCNGSGKCVQCKGTGEF